MSTLLEKSITVNRTVSMSGQIARAIEEPVRINILKTDSATIIEELSN